MNRLPPNHTLTATPFPTTTLVRSHKPGDTEAVTVGPPLGPHVEVRIDTPDAQGIGEIVARRPNMFAGYLRNPEAEAESMHEGWVRTGDAGYLTPKGPVVVIDRLKDMAHLRGRLRFSPHDR